MTEPVRYSPILGKNLQKALMAAGIADEMTKRVTIDIPATGAVTVYIERVGDARMLDIVPAIATDPSLKIERIPAEENDEQSD